MFEKYDDKPAGNQYSQEILADCYMETLRARPIQTGRLHRARKAKHPQTMPRNTEESNTPLFKSTTFLCLIVRTIAVMVNGF